MIELTVLCEGPTEVGFVSQVLKPHFAARQVFCKPIALNRANFGVVSWEKLYRAIKGAIGDSRRHQYTTCMIDLYGLPDYPGRSEPAADPLRTVQNIEAALRTELPNERWIPYIQLHEFEALLFTDLGSIDEAMSNYDLSRAIAKLTESVTGMRPEEIDEGRDTAPSKRILRFVPEYGKAQIGPAAAERIGIERLRAACPHFAEWVDTLEGLASADVAAGEPES